MTPPVRVLVCDDQALIRTGLATIIDAQVKGKPGGGGFAPNASCCGMVKRYSPPSRIRCIASAKPGNTCEVVNGCAPPCVSLLSNTAPSSEVRT